MESANAVTEYAFTVLKAKKLFAGHNPINETVINPPAELGRLTDA